MTRWHNVREIGVGWHYIATGSLKVGDRPYTSHAHKIPRALVVEMEKPWPAPLGPYGLLYAGHCFSRAHARENGSAQIIDVVEG
jgi:hypothetical protein